MDHNPFLERASALAAEFSADAPEKGAIEGFDGSANLVWQTRAAPPTEYETRLGDALEIVFGEGIESLEGVVARLNALGVKRPGGEPWDAPGFESEMRRLGG